MGLSETIVAAIIGALATMGTAIFQLVRNRAPSETRPKKNRTRSVLATIALMIGCIVGGYAWSALRAVSSRKAGLASSTRPSGVATSTPSGSSSMTRAKGALCREPSSLLAISDRSMTSTRHLLPLAFENGRACRPARS